MVLRGHWSNRAPGRRIRPRVDGRWAHRGSGRRTTPAAKSVATPTPPADANEQSDTTTDDEPQQALRPRLVSITSDPTSDPTPEATSDEMSEGEEVSDTSTPATVQDTLIPEEAEAPKRAKRTKSKRGRASVPSWDEILFGATKDSE